MGCGKKREIVDSMRLFFTYQHCILTIMFFVVIVIEDSVLLARSPHNSFASNCHYIIEPVPDQMLIIDNGMFDSLKPGDTICLAAGDFSQILIRNIHGSADSLITIRNVFGQVLINNQAHYGIAFHNSSFIRLIGDGCENYKYGFSISGVQSGNGVSVDQKSTNVEISYIEIANVGRSGIMVKTDPRCDDLSSVRELFTLYDTKIHNCHIHNTVNEGIYIGSSYYYPGFPLICNGKDTLVLPHELIGVEVYNNIIERTGRNSVQVSSATMGCVIHNNTIIEDSQSAINFHMNAIQVGGGSRCDVFNNIIIDGKGSGVHYFGRGHGKIFNNLILNPGRTHYPDLPANQFPVHGVFVNHVYTDTPDPIHVVNNTIINPKTDGIRFDNQHTQNNLLKNNIIINPGAFAHIGMEAFIRSEHSDICVDVSHNFFDTDINTAAFSDTLTNDYSLKQTSPAINAGIDLQDMGVTFDINNNTRPFGPTSDIGAYEYQYIVPDNTNPEITIYPNPATTSINILFQYITTDVKSVSIYDVAGRLVFRRKPEEACPFDPIPVNQLSQGIYHLKVLFDNTTASGSFIKL